MRFFKTTNVDFVGKRRLWYVLSLIIVTSGLVAAAVKGVEMGIDFAGGTEVQLDFQRDVEIEAVRQSLSAANFRGAEVKYYGKDESGVLIRVPQGAHGAKTGDQLTQDILQVIGKSFPDNQAEMLQNQHIGPKIGAELQQKAFLAVIASSLMILTYLALRFKPIYGLASVVAIVHDVLVAFAFAVIFNNVFPWLNLEMNSTLLAAFLSLVGFSTNDTVIIFDRIREDSKRYVGQDLKTIINRAVNETLQRTVITSGTVFLTLVTLFIWGGEVLRGFAFTMGIGVLISSYTSINLTSGLVYDLSTRGKNKNLRSDTTNEPLSMRRERRQEAVPA